MKDSQGTFQSSLALKSLYDKVQNILCCRTLPDNYKRLETKLELKLMEIKRSSSRNMNFKSIDSIIMKFPQLREGLNDLRNLFEQYDEDSHGTVDNEELKKCFRTLGFSISEEEIDDLIVYCDMDESKGIQFKEFIVVICLVFLLADSPSSPQKLKVFTPEIEATFDTIIQVFLFLDKNGVGRLKKKDIVKAFNEASPKEKSPSHITRTRFSYSLPSFDFKFSKKRKSEFDFRVFEYAEEMDWDKNGKVSFKEFLFSFINWVGIDCEHEE